MRNSINWYDWKPGSNVLRLLPGFDPRHCDPEPDLSGPMPEGAREHFAIEVKRSSNVGPNKRTVYLDPGEPGPLEQHVDRLKSAGDERSKKEADVIRPKNRAMFFVIDRDNEKAGPQCVDWNLIEYNKILAVFADPEHGDIACPFSGTDLVIEYIPKDKSNNGYPQWPSVSPRRQISLLAQDDEQWREWLGRDHFKDAGLDRFSSTEYIEACLNGTEEGVEEFEPEGAGETRFFWMKVTSDEVKRRLKAGEDPEILEVYGAEKSCSASEIGLQ